MLREVVQRNLVKELVSKEDSGRTEAKKCISKGDVVPFYTGNKGMVKKCGSKSMSS